MQRCSSSHIVGPCSCGVFHTGSHHHQANSTFSMLFSMPYDGEACPYSSPPSSSVDCTLSLGTPSTRLSSSNEYEKPHHERRPSSNWSSNFCWDILQPSKHSVAPPSHKGNRCGNSSSATADPLLARRCANCDTTSTPLWRNGPRGPKSLCNACGIRFKKEERRANAAAAVTDGGGDAMESHHQHMMNGNPWVHHTQGSHKMPSCYSPAAAIGNEFRFIDEVDDRDSPFLSWRLNVTDRPGLVHDFTR